MKKRIRFFSLLLILALLCGCAAAPDGASEATADTESPSAAPTGSAAPTSPSTPEPTDSLAPTDAVEPIDDEEQLYEQLFDPAYKVELRLHMDDTQLAALQADYESYKDRGSKSPIYRMADLDVTITAPDGTARVYCVDQVGVRMKGNTSRTDFYSEDEGVYKLIHLKLSFQETFDDEVYYGSDALVWKDEESREARKDRTFATLEKLYIRWNKCNDSTYVRESYAYEMFRANGVLAPRTTLASVDWADLHCGVYTLCEPVDKVFLKRNLPKSQRGGDLYKLGWTSSGASFTSVGSIGVKDEDSGAFFTYDLKTNKKKSEHERLIALITALNGGDVDKESFAALVDADSFLSFAAVSYLLGNPDDLRNNYNNCYVYFPPDGGCIFIPTDYDRCLGLTYEWDPTGDGVSTDDPFSLTMAATGNKQENPLLLYSVCKGGYYVEEFSERLEALLSSEWASEAHFADYFAQAQALYDDLTTPEKDFRNLGERLTAMRLNGNDGNLPVADYLRAKLAAARKALAEIDTSADPQLPADLYIRAEFTNWEIWDEYAMRAQGDGVYAFTLSGGRFKIYSRLRDAWFGSEVLQEDVDVPWQTDDHTNIILPEGSYIVYFDTKTCSIFIECA